MVFERPFKSLYVYLLLGVIIFFLITSICFASTPKPRSYYGVHVDENGTTTVILRPGEGYNSFTGEITPCKKTSGIEPLRRVR